MKSKHALSEARQAAETLVGILAPLCERIEDAARTARREWKPLQDDATHDDLPLFAEGAT